MFEHRDYVKHCSGVKLFIVLAGLLGASPGILLQEDELQDQSGCPARPLHHHRVSAVFQNIHLALRQHLFNDHGSRDIHHLDKHQTRSHTREIQMLMPKLPGLACPISLAKGL